MIRNLRFRESFLKYDSRNDINEPLENSWKFFKNLLKYKL